MGQHIGSGLGELVNVRLSLSRPTSQPSDKNHSFTQCHTRNLFWEEQKAPGQKYTEFAEVTKLQVHKYTKFAEATKLQVHKYTKFGEATRFNSQQPEQLDVMAFIAQLDTTLRSPGALLNYLSGTKTWTRLMGGSLDGFDTYQV